MKQEGKDQPSQAKSNFKTIIKAHTVLSESIVKVLLKKKKKGWFYFLLYTEDILRKIYMR